MFIRLEEEDIIWLDDGDDNNNGPLRVPPSPPTPTLMGAGLWNMGNTCFLNAVLQCFTHTVPLVRALRAHAHAIPCPQGDGNDFCILCALRDHIDQSLASSGDTIFPMKLVNNLNNISPLFRRYRQEDAHEFLQCLLDKLDSCCLDSELENRASSSQDDSFVKEIYGGRLRSQLQCCSCGHCSDSFESLNDLSLEIKDADTILTALNSFTQVERIGGEETKFCCEGCKQEVSLEKRFTLEKISDIATLHLKRFRSNGFLIEKICQFVAYPLELDFRPFLSTPNNNDISKSKYELYAVLVHRGIFLDSGHYLCFIRCSPDSWYRLDDDMVFKVSEFHVLQQEAYILFYKRQGSPWFSSLMEKELSLRDLDCLSSSVDSMEDELDAFERSIKPRRSRWDAQEITCASLAQPSSSSSTMNSDQNTWVNSGEEENAIDGEDSLYFSETPLKHAYASKECEEMGLTRRRKRLARQEGSSTNLYET